ncbi:hypothetical protein AHAS_Ahas05G0141200 [Arachis hypogaea]
MVQEFYGNMWITYKNVSGINERNHKTFVRGRTIDFSPETIRQALQMPETEQSLSSYSERMYRYQQLEQEQHFPPQDYLQQLAASMEQMWVANDSRWEQYMASVEEMRAIQNSRWEHLYTSLDEIRADQCSQR